jgi:hypothetical protein
MGLSYPTNFVRFVSTILSVEIASVTTATEPANSRNDSQNVALRTGDNHNDDNEGEGVVHGPTVLAHVDLATRVGTLSAVFVCLLTNIFNPVARRTEGAQRMNLRLSWANLTS